MFDQLRQSLQRRLDKLTGQSAPLPTPVSDPEYANSLRVKGNAFLSEEKLEAAEACFREALEHNADDTRTLVCLGYALKEQGRLTEARVVLKRATNPANTDPEVFEALYLLGEISEAQADLEDAIRHFKSVLNLKPDFTRACKKVARILQLQGRNHDMKAFLEDQVRLCSSNSDYRLMLAKAYTDTLEFQGTVDNLLAAVALGVSSVPINMMIGAALCRLEREEDARPYFEMARVADPSVTHEINYHQGYFHTRSGNTRAAIGLLERSLELEPDYLPSHSLLLLLLSHAATELNRSYRVAAENFATTVENSHPRLPDLHPSPVEMDSRVLRIGFVSGEFVEHPIYHFLIGILEQIDKTRFHLVAFSNNQVNDACTAVFKALFSEWHDIQNMGHAAVAELVRTQQIDVLFDLSGHTGDARLPVFAYKPALVQVAWLGYFASTGLKTMDYIIADEACVPKDSGEWFSEKIVRLPDTRLCMTAPRTSRPIPVAQPPCLTKGYVTFGSFQQAAKINRQVLLVWARVMASVPQSRLRIQNKGVDSATTEKKLREDMVIAGMDLSRVDLVGATGWEEYLEAHCETDILLDTFPYPGGTTTAFALWMGVPTVTLTGTTMLSLQGASMLECVGLTDWIAKTATEYVDIANRFAGDTDAIIRLRQQLRVTAESSPLFDCKRFASNLEDAIGFMYHDRMASVTVTQPHVRFSHGY